ncbi:MAG TPA: M48 family metallopeptidase [Gemmatimonadaceae bacterium]|nr:M48 family metallopeptidase [Gemmatimonadaceae bacterium]
MRRKLLGATLALVTAGCAISTQQEVQMGTDYSQQINAQLPIVDDPEISRYINVLGDSIAKLSDDRNLDWHFFVVNSAEVNAFAVPGGFVYVNRGLIERARDVSMLAGVLGHEIAHVTERHSIHQMQNAQKANVGVTLACVLTRICESGAGRAAINVGGSALFASFSRQDEADADAKAVPYVVRAGIDPRGIPAMFQVLLDERQRQPGAVDAWFSTHPLEEDRIASTQALIAKIDPLILQSLTRDTPNYQRFRQRVSELPPPPPPRGQ